MRIDHCWRNTFTSFINLLGANKLQHVNLIEWELAFEIWINHIHWYCHDVKLLCHDFNIKKKTKIKRMKTIISKLGNYWTCQIKFLIRQTNSGFFKHMIRQPLLTKYHNMFIFIFIHPTPRVERDIVFDSKIKSWY